jgi:hypothetical protein
MNFFPTSRITQEREKSSTDELPTRFAVMFFLSYESLKSRKRRIFLLTSYIQGHVRGSRWVRQGWSVAKKKGGPEKEKKKTKEGKKVAPRRQGSVCPQPRISFFGSRVFGFWETRLVWSISSYETYSTRKPCAKEVPETDYLTQGKQYLERTTLRRLKIPLRSIVARKGRTIALEQSVSEKAVKDKRQSTFFHKLGILGDSYLGCTA